MRYIFLISIAIFFILHSTAFAFKCDKCHRDDKVLNKIVQEREIKTKEELFNSVRKGKFSKLHKNLTDEEILEAGYILNLK